VVVSANSIGLYPDLCARAPIDIETLDASMAVCDVIPTPDYCARS
jgi:hypothetical protein